MKQTIAINAKAKDIFFALSDVETQKKWVVGLVDIKQPEGYGVGKPFVLYLKEGNKVSKYDGTTDEIQENKLLVVSMWNNDFRATSRYTLEEKDTHTLLSFESTMAFSTFFSKIMGATIVKLFSYFMLKIMLKNLKKLVETKN